MATKNQKTTAAQFEKEVRTAANKLEQEGARITNAAIREKLGGGSFRDISPIVKAINAEKEARAKAESQVPDMPEEVAELTTAIWEAAYRSADEVAAAERRAHAEEIKALREEVAERESEVSMVEDELEEAQARVKTAETAKAGLEEQVTDLRVIIAGLEGRLLGRQEAAPEEDKGPKKAPDEIEDVRQMPLFDDPAGDEGLPLSGNNGDTMGGDLVQDQKDNGGLNDEAA